MKNLNIQQINEIYKDLAYIIMTEKEFIEIVKNITEQEKESSRIIEKIRQHVLKKIDDNSNILEILDEIIKDTHTETEIEENSSSLIAYFQIKKAPHISINKYLRRFMTITK